MICTLDDLRSKEVIDIKTGERLGYIDDAELNLETSDVVSLVIYGRARVFGFLGREEDIVVTCGEIKVVGREVVLVQRDDKPKSLNYTKEKKSSFRSLFK